MTKKKINFVESSVLPTEIANFQVHAFTEIDSNKDHLAITIGNIGSGHPILSRVHSQCITGESFFSLRCDCRNQLSQSLREIAEKGAGVIFYLAPTYHFITSVFILNENLSLPKLIAFIIIWIGIIIFIIDVIKNENKFIENNIQ